MRRIVVATAASLALASLMASAAQAQQSSSTITTYQTPAGPVTVPFLPEYAAMRASFLIKSLRVERKSDRGMPET